MSTTSSSSSSSKAKRTTTVAKTKMLRDGSGKAESVENTAILLPRLADGSGPVALGDLWNCRTNTVEGNLFDGPLDENYLQADPIQSLEYSFENCKNSEKVANRMFISAELKADFASGATKVNVSGKGSYESDDKSTFNEENVVVEYETLTYQVRVRPSASTIISKQIKELLADKTIAATHFCQAVLCGGKAVGCIRYKEKTSDSKMEILGEFKLTISLASITIDAQAKFELLDTELKENYETKVNVSAQPRLRKSPTTCKQLFEEVEYLDTLVDNERHFPSLDKKDPSNPNYVMRVTGVPIKFRMVPLAQILAEADVDELFELIQEELMEDFSSMLFTLKDYANPNFMRQRIHEMQPSVIPILLQDTNPLTADLIEYAMAKAEQAQRLRSEAARIYIDYKTKGKTADDLRTMVNKYDLEFNLFNVTAELDRYIQKAKAELAGVRASDVNGIVDEEGNPSIRFFYNKIDLDDWYGTERTIKILLRTAKTGESSPTGVFLRLYDMSPALAKYGIEVGVAFPSISDNKFDMSYKSQWGETIYDVPKDIRFALQTLAIAVDEDEGSIAKIFYSMNAALSGLHLPMQEHLFDVPNLVTVMKEYDGIVISETYCDLLARLLESLDTWNFVFPVQALDTGIEAMRFFRQLRHYIPQRFPELRHRFMVGRFNDVSDKHASPLMLIFKDNIFQAVCLDQLDILIMMEQFARLTSGATTEPDWNLLAFQNIRQSCLYPHRADWGVSVIQNLILDHRTFNSDPIPPLEEFEDNDNGDLAIARRVTRVAAIRSERLILTTVAHLALETEVENNSGYRDALETLLGAYGWKDNEFNILAWKEIDWATFYGELKNFLSSQAPFLMKVVLALKELNDLPLRPPQPEPKPPETSSTELQEQPTDIQLQSISPLEVEWTDEQLNAMIDKIIIFITNSSSMAYRWRRRIIDEADMFADLRNEVLSYAGMPGKIRKTGIIKLLEQFVANATGADELFHLYNMTLLVEGMQDSKFKSLKQALFPLCQRYCTKFTIEEELYPRGQRRLNDSLKEKQLFKTVGVLAEVSAHPLLYIIQQEFFNFDNLPAPVNVKSILEKMTQNMPTSNPPEFVFTEEQLELIWTNPKFQYILRQVMASEGVQEALLIFVTQWNKRQEALKKQQRQELLLEDEEEEEFGEDMEALDIGDGIDVNDLKWPYWMPQDVVEKVKSLIVLREKANYPYPKEWIDVPTMLEALQIIYTRQIIPYDFSQVLQKNVLEVALVKKELEDSDILFYWNDNEGLFEPTWSILTVNRAVEVLKEKYPDKDPEAFKKTPTYNSCDKKEIALKTSNIPASLIPEEELETTITVNETWKKLVRGGVLPKISMKNFLHLDSWNPVALTEYDELGQAAKTTLRFLQQQMKMGNSAALDAQFFEKYVNYPPPGPRPGVIDFGEGIPVWNLGLLFSRGDFQNALFQLADPVVTYLTLVSMAKSPVPLPLLVPSIEENQTTTKSGEVPSHATLMLPALQDVIVPEMEALVPQPRLFRDPYRFVLTLRVGNVTPDIMGRSSFVNSHLMKSSTFFGSRLDPGASAGVPVSRNGSLEFSWLSESTCAPEFWTNVVEPHYTGQRKQMILLGVLHGDALSFPSLFEVLRHYVSCYVVFWKATNLNDLKAKKKLLNQSMGLTTDSKVLDLIMYPDPTIIDKVNDQNLLFRQVPGEYQHIVNKAKIQNVFENAINFTVRGGENSIPLSTKAYEPSVACGSTTSSFISTLTSNLSGGVGVPKGAKQLSTLMPITVAPAIPVSTPESSRLLAFITQHSIGNIQDAIEFPAEYAQIIDDLVSLFVEVLNLPDDQRRKAITHFTWELDFLSRTSTVEWKERISKLRSQIESKIATSVGVLDEKWVLRTQQEMRMALKQLRRNSLTMHDLWRLVVNYNANSSSIKQLRRLNGDFISSGFSFEMFHPTHSSRLWDAGILEALQEFPSDTRILVVSAFGPKSSGKSTLLNALFGSGFPEDGSTCGLQGRLLWLNSQLRASLDCDAFVLIDSEGVGAPENAIDEGADEAERKLVTFLLGISSVSLATILGPSTKELNDILQVSLSGLGKVNSLDVTPDVYLVQQYVPEQPDAGAAPQEFAASLASSIRITTELELQLGVRVTEAHRLKQVTSRNKHAEVVHQIRSRGSLTHQDLPDYVNYNDDVQNLYKKIIHVAAVSRGNRLTLGQWLRSTFSVWEEVRMTDLPYKCRSAKNVIETVDYDNSIASIKTAIDAAFFYHEKKEEGAFQVEIDWIFKNTDDNGFDSTLDAKFNSLYSKLIKVVNACDEMEQSDNPTARRRVKLRQARTAEVNASACLACSEAFSLREKFFAAIRSQKRAFLVEEEISRYTSEVRDSIYERIRQGVIARQILEQRSDGDLKKKLDVILGEQLPIEESWGKWLQAVSTSQYVIPARHRFTKELLESYTQLPHVTRRYKPEGEESHVLIDLKPLPAFDVEIYNSALESAMNVRKPVYMTWEQHDWLIARLVDIPNRMKDDFESALYRPGMARDLRNRVARIILLFEEFCGELCLPNFKWEVHFYAIQLFGRFIDEQQATWDVNFTDRHDPVTDEVISELSGNNPLKVLRNMKETFVELDGDFFNLSPSP